MVPRIESLFICSPLNTNLIEIKEGIKLGDLKSMLENKILEKLNHTSSVTDIVDKLIEFGDVNFDQEVLEFCK